jgi:hypothetical protein
MMKTLTAVPLALVLLLVLVGLSKFGTGEEIELRHRSSPPAAGSKEFTKVSSCFNLQALSSRSEQIERFIKNTDDCFRITSIVLPSQGSLKFHHPCPISKDEVDSTTGESDTPILEIGKQAMR